MNRFKNISLFTILLAVTAGVLLGIRGIESKLDNTIDQEQLRFSGKVADAPPIVAFSSVALGSFRGLLADVLWLRSETLKSKKNYFEMVQLARWITDLQPNYSGGTAYLAWNLAYNISVTSSDHEDRWYWVNEGIKLIRDKALDYNPDDPVLYKELAWIFSHKLGNVLDDANLYYKRQLALQMMMILGDERPDIEALASAPASEEAFMEIFPADHRLWGIAAAAGCKNYQELYTLFRTPIPAALPETFKNSLGEKDFNTVQNAFRVRLLNEKLRLDAQKMAEIDRRYGKMDWRVPESQAIYWATIGMDKNGANDVHCMRIVTQSLQSAFRSGKLLMIRDKDGNPDIQITPNLALADAAYENFLRAQKIEEERHLGSAESFRSARINYLKDAIPLIYINGNVSKAKEFFQKLLKEDGPQKQKTLDEFVMVEFAEDVRDADVKKAHAVISGLIQRSILNLIYGNREAAVANERLANYIYRKYSAENRDVKRNTLPPYSQLKSGILEWNRANLPPAMVTILNAAIAAEKAETKEEKAM
ncbi:MAG: hypothetical protein IKA71_00185 [Lentisphaeria bacterium]|nr:hypothetical protein [Lentisphaeria bacterium]